MTLKDTILDLGVSDVAYIKIYLPNIRNIYISFKACITIIHIYVHNVCWPLGDSLASDWPHVC